MPIEILTVAVSNDRSGDADDLLGNDDECESEQADSDQAASSKDRGDSPDEFEQEGNRSENSLAALSPGTRRERLPRRPHDERIVHSAR